MKYLRLKAPEKKQADPKLIRFENGILDIETMELAPANGSDIVLNKIPHKWNPSAKSELVDKTLSSIALGDPAVMANLWEMIGLAMYRGHEVSRMFLLHGAGANGKSTLLNLLKYAIGEDNCFALSINDLGEKFQLVPAMGKLAIVGDDIASDCVGARAVSVMKKFVTGEAINDQYKGGATFQFEPYATLIYSCNEIPRFADATFGFERRVHPIPLHAKFSPGGDGYDPKLGQKLRTEESAEYVLAMAVYALKDCLDRGEPTPNPLSKELTRGIMQNNDPTLAFISEAKSKGREFVGMSNDEAYGLYQGWCADYGIAPLGKQAFSKKLCNHEKLTSRSSNGKRRFAMLPGQNA